MQNRFTSTVPALCFLVLGLVLATACKKDNSGGNTPAAGQWKVTYFFDKQVETANYTGYTFEFEPGGALVAKNGGQTWNGTWSTNCDDSANKFCIDFSGTGSVPSALGELQEDWLIIEMQSTFMHFEHVSGGNGDTDIVHFTKI
ncbi:MAG: hypothetical protein ABMA02_07245 [Saprospiraceae bacterium]